MLLKNFFLLSIFSIISFEYKTDCDYYYDLSQNCTIYMTPFEDTYTDLFISSIDPQKKMLHDFESVSNSVDPRDIVRTNEDIRKLVSESEMKAFIVKFNKKTNLNLLFRPYINITLVEDINSIVVPSELTTITTTKSIITTTPKQKSKIIKQFNKYVKKPLKNFIDIH
uniref:Fam-a protein n=1 Tax=Strongyloides stercoralis TaxID=6248 RepID=A0A0K0DWK7_STRER